jgi:hypothetical protein
MIVLNEKVKYLRGALTLFDDLLQNSRIYFWT